MQRVGIISGVVAMIGADGLLLSDALRAAVRAAVRAAWGCGAGARGGCGSVSGGGANQMGLRGVSLTVESLIHRGNL